MKKVIEGVCIRKEERSNPYGYLYFFKLLGASPEDEIQEFSQGSFFFAYPLEIGDRVRVTVEITAEAEPIEAKDAEKPNDVDTA